MSTPFSTSSASSSSRYDFSKGPTLKLYQFESCPYCTKVRAYLDHYQIPYEVAPVSPLPHQKKRDLKSYAIDPSRKVPVVRSPPDERELTESNDIITYLDHLRKHGTPPEESAATPSENSSQSSEEIDVEKWRKWADDVLVKLLPLNVYGTIKEAFDMSTHVVNTTPNATLGTRLSIQYIAPFFLQRVHAVKAKKENNPLPPRERLYNACNEWVNAVTKRGDEFHGGAVPDLADLAVFGILQSIEDQRAFTDTLANSRIEPWYRAMKGAHPTHSSRRHLAEDEPVAKAPRAS